MLETIKPREQDGRDAFSRYRAQVRSAAMASLSILEGLDIDKVYCDFHDDFVIRKKSDSGYGYLFYQVKTKGKQNHNWTLSEVFGLNSRIKDQSKQESSKIKDSFLGKLILHTVVFDEYCNNVVFQTNIHTSDDIDEIMSDIESGSFENKFTKVLIDRFNNCFPCEKSGKLSVDKIKSKLSKLKFHTDVQYLKNKNNNFEPAAREKIYEFSEIDLSYEESRKILLKLLDLVARKSSGVIEELTNDSIDHYAAISIEDLLSILSISQGAYEVILQGGDAKAIKSASIIQRILSESGAGDQEIEYCSRCKTRWDVWLRKNRHVLLELDLNTITSKIKSVILSSFSLNTEISISSIRSPIMELASELESEGLLFDLNVDMILGAVFSELVRVNS